MSMTMLEMSIEGLAFSAADIKCTGFDAMIPGIYSPLALRTSTLLDTKAFLFQPPSCKKRRQPLGLMEWTMRPTSSE